MDRADAPTRSWDLFALWVLTGLVGVLTLMAMMSIGIFILPFTMALLALATFLTTRRHGSWPSIAGLGVALAAGVAWFGWIVGTAGPSEQSCSGSSDGPTVCTSGGKVIDPNAVDWSLTAPWLGVAVLILAAAVTGWWLLTRSFLRPAVSH